MKTDERKNRPSASGIERLSLCPGSWNLEQQCEEQAASEDAERGTRIHATIEHWSKENVFGDEVSGEELECAEACAAIIGDVVSNWNGGRSASPIAIAEKRIWFKESFSGKPDLLYLSSDRALVIDVKTGRGDVAESAENIQLRALAVLVKWQHPLLAEITVSIVQPLAGKPQMCVYDSSALRQAREQIIDLIEASENPAAPINPGEKQCRYCRAALTCPAVNRQLAMASEIDVKPKVWETLTTTEKLAQYDLACAFLKVADRIKNRCKDDLVSGLEIPGLTLKEGVFREKITDPNTVHQRFLAMGGTTEQFMPCVSITKSSLRESVRSASGRKGKVLDSTMDELLLGCTETKQNAASVERDELL